MNVYEVEFPTLSWVVAETAEQALQIAYEEFEEEYQDMMDGEPDVSPAVRQFGLDRCVTIGGEILDDFREYQRPYVQESDWGFQAVVPVPILIANESMGVFCSESWES